ncbi:Activated CDC42 kinase 1 [Chionoecetes opilio]|uniref:non-specific protein-tyrosine kinase n=1 Tax=Chionoecetes opilio TaxID=41210 RepID=A0A8J4YNP1_CHIOP|nr:Activated CDC42 kinase 1 [Chionoecetes opilio]
MGDVDGEELETVRAVLAEVQLGQFFTRVRDDLQVTRLSHFEFVQLEDLERIGLGKPASRRLLEAVRKRRTAAWMKGLVSRILPSTTSSSQGKHRASTAPEDSHTLGLTCLIPEQASQSVPGSILDVLNRQVVSAESIGSFKRRLDSFMDGDERWM